MDIFDKLSFDCRFQLLETVSRELNIEFWERGECVNNQKMQDVIKKHGIQLTINCDPSKDDIKHYVDTKIMAELSNYSIRVEAVLKVLDEKIKEINVFRKKLGMVDVGDSNGVV